MIRGILATGLILGAMASGGAAQAALYDITAQAGFAPSGTLFFTLPEDPVVSSFALDGTSFTIDHVDYFSGALCGPCTGQFTFYTVDSNKQYGGFSGGPVAPYSGAQLFSGTVEQPHFELGTYKIILGDISTSYEEGTVLIAPSAMTGTPEPATWAMLIAGFGAVGLALRARGSTFAPRARSSRPRTVAAIGEGTDAGPRRPSA